MGLEGIGWVGITVTINKQQEFNFMSYDIKVITPKGNKVELKHDHGVEFYFYADSKDMAKYPTYTTGKCKGDIAFTKGGGLVMAGDLYTKIIHANGHLRDGKKNVHLSLDSGVSITFKKPVFYSGILLEWLKADFDKACSRNLHSMEGVEENYNKYVLPYKAIMEKTTLNIEVEVRKECYSYLYIEGHYIDNSYEIDQVLKYLDCYKDGKHTVNFKAQLKNVFGEYVEYTSLDELCQK